LKDASESCEVMDVMQQLEHLQHELSHKMSLQQHYLESLSAHLNLLLHTHTTAQESNSVAAAGMQPIPKLNSVDLATRPQQACFIDDVVETPRGEYLDKHLDHAPLAISPLRRRSVTGAFNVKEDADCVTRFAAGSIWAFTSMILVLLNTAVIGYETQLMTQYHINRALGDNDISFDDTWFKAAEVIFLVWMVIEVVVNAYAQRWDFVTGKDSYWNLFDMAIVAISTAMLLVQAVSVTFLRVLRLFRLGKIMRVFRAFKFLRGVRSMVISMSGSFMHLVSAMLVMCVFIYVVSLVLMQGIASDAEERNDFYGLPITRNAKVGTVFEFASGMMPHAGDVSHAGDWERVNTLYGSIDRAMMTLFLSVSNGITWSAAAEPIAKLGTFYGMVWTAFMAFMLFGMLNVLTGIFVDAAIKAMMNDRDNMIQAQMDERDSLVSTIHAVFKDMDADGSGNITEAEFDVLLRDEELALYLSALGIQHREAKCLFTLLDEDQSGKLTIDEFVNGFLKLKGGAKAFDTALLMAENLKIRKKLVKLSEETKLLCGSCGVTSAAGGTAVTTKQPQLQAQQRQQQQQHASQWSKKRPSFQGSPRWANLAPATETQEGVLDRVLAEISFMLEQTPSEFAKLVHRGEEATVNHPEGPWLEDPYLHVEPTSMSLEAPTSVQVPPLRLDKVFVSSSQKESAVWRASE